MTFTIQKMWLRSIQMNLNPPLTIDLGAWRSPPRGIESMRSGCLSHARPQLWLCHLCCTNSALCTTAEMTVLYRGKYVQRSHAMPRRGEIYTSKIEHAHNIPVGAGRCMYLESLKHGSRLDCSDQTLRRTGGRANNTKTAA